MPLLVYSYPDFTPNTVILSARVNAKFNDISTLLNTTKLDDTNIQDAGITRSTKLKVGTANYVLINAADGTMSEEAQLSTSRGGTGVSLSPTALDVGKVLQIDSSGSFVLSTPPESPGSKLFNYSRLY